jgi:hypothetical protein
MTDDDIRTVLRSSDGRSYWFTFSDGEKLFASVASDTHVDEDDTILIIRVGAVPGECGWQVRLADIVCLNDSSGACLFGRSLPRAVGDCKRT